MHLNLTVAIISECMRISNQFVVTLNIYNVGLSIYLQIDDHVLEQASAGVFGVRNGEEGNV